MSCRLHANHNAPDQRSYLGSNEKLDSCFDSFRAVLGGEEMTPPVRDCSLLLQIAQKWLVLASDDLAFSRTLMNEPLDVVEFGLETGEAGEVFQEEVKPD